MAPKHRLTKAEPAPAEVTPDEVVPPTLAGIPVIEVPHDGAAQLDRGPTLVIGDTLNEKIMGYAAVEDVDAAERERRFASHVEAARRDMALSQLLSQRGVMVAIITSSHRCDLTVATRRADEIILHLVENPFTPSKT